MITRGFLAAVGFLYLGLAIWCTLDPKTTSDHVGFDLPDDSGRSEFMTVYGGLELGLALLFFLPLIRPDWITPVLLSCTLLHGSLVAFRTASLFLFPDISPMTRNLAVGEWIILLASGLLLTQWDR